MLAAAIGIQTISKRDVRRTVLGNDRSRCVINQSNRSPVYLGEILVIPFKMRMIVFLMDSQESVRWIGKGSVPHTGEFRIRRTSMQPDNR